MENPQTGKLTNAEAKPLLFYAIRRMNEQTSNLMLDMAFGNDKQEIVKKITKIKLTAQEIIDCCCEGD